MLGLLKSGLFRRLFTATLLVAILIMILSLVSASYDYQNHIRQETELRHDAMARRIALEMGLFFDQAAYQLTVVAGFVNNIPIDHTELSTTLNEVCLNAPHFMEIAVTAIDGRQLGGSAPGLFSPEESVKALKATKEGKNWFSKVYLDSNRVPYLEMSVPIKTFISMTGMVMGRLSLKKLWYWIDEIQDQNTTSLTVVKSENGLVIADQTKRFIGKTYEGWTSVRVNHAFEDYSGPHYISYYEVPGLDLTIITVSRIGTFSEYLTQAPLRLAGAAFGLVGLAALMAGIFSARATRPVRLLIEGMNEYAKSGKRIYPGLGGEHERIAMAFNQVAVTLEENIKAMVTQESLVVVGRVAAILAHELRHELQMINNLVYLMEAQAEEKNALNRIVAEMAKKISGIMDLARGSKIEPELWGALRLLDDAMEYTHLCEYGVGVDMGVEKDGAQEFTIMVDKGKVSMAISNMIRNSVEAQATKVRISCRLENGCAVYTVLDNGSGMNAETLEKMMDPFYTTKRKGYGLGLSFVNSVSRSHGGRAKGENLPGGGAKFQMYIPVAGADIRAAKAKKASLAAGGVDI